MQQYPLGSIEHFLHPCLHLEQEDTSVEFSFLKDLFPVYNDWHELPPAQQSITQADPLGQSAFDEHPGPQAPPSAHEVPLDPLFWKHTYAPLGSHGKMSKLEMQSKVDTQDDEAG